jgi:bacillopeptidase F (M6 metalloprotease family)
VFSSAWLREHSYSGSVKGPNAPAAKSWDKQFFDRLISANYLDLMQHDSALYA